MINLTENLDCYDIEPSIQDYEDLAQYVLHERDTYDYSTLRVLEDYIDYESFGRDVAESEGGSIEDNTLGEVLLRLMQADCEKSLWFSEYQLTITVKRGIIVA